MSILAIRKLADKTSSERVVRFDPETGERKLVNPHTVGNAHEPWPLKGVVFCDPNGMMTDPPQETAISTTKVDEGQTEGWLTRENPRVVNKPGGPEDNPLLKVHTFIHADTLVFHTLDGDVRYTVVKQPDKVDDEVTWYYGLQLEETTNG